MKKIFFSLFVVLLFAGCQKTQSVPDVATGATISGLISLSPELSKKQQPSDVLYIIARKDVGPPLAVKRIENPKFPVAYILTAENTMFPGTPFQGEVKVSARLDRDGNAGPAQPGDIEGISLKNPARVGDRDVDIVIDKEW